MKKTIEVKNPAGLPVIPWTELKKSFEPNGLKKKKDRNVSDLKAAILSMGFTVPLFVWVEGKYIADGAGRFLALDMLEYEGYVIPDIPYVPLEAKNRKEAKRLTLAISSQYGVVSPDSLGEFMLEMNEIDLSFIQIGDYNLEEIDWKPPAVKTKEKRDVKGVTKMQHTCPNCNFKFTTGDEKKPE